MIRWSHICDYNSTNDQDSPTEWWISFTSIPTVQFNSLVCTRTDTMSSSTNEDTTIVCIQKKTRCNFYRRAFMRAIPKFFFLQNKYIHLCLAMRRIAESVAIQFWAAVRSGDLISGTVCMWAFERLAFLRFYTVFATDDLLLLEHKSIYF